MGKINCICKIDDVIYKKALESMFMYSGWFNVVTEKNEHYTNEKLLLIVDEQKMKNFLSHGDELQSYHVVLLTESEGNGDSRLESLMDLESGTFDDLLLLEVFKYKPFSELLVQVNDFYELEMPLDRYRQLGKGVLVKSLCLFSASGGVGASTIGIGVGRSLYRMGFKVLYLDLAPVSLRSKKEQDDMSKVLYSIIRGRKVNLEQYIKAEDGIYYISRGPINNALDIIDKSLIQRLMEIGREAGFEIIIFDIGSHVSDRITHLMRMADYGICVFPTDYSWIEKGMPGLREISGKGPVKTLKVINNSFGCGEVNDGMQELLESLSFVESSEMETGKVDLAIPYYEDLSKRSIDGDYGRKIKVLVELMLGS